MQVGQKQRVNLAARTAGGQQTVADAGTAIDQQPATGAAIDKIGRAMTVQVNTGTAGAEQSQFHYPYSAVKRSP